MPKNYYFENFQASGEQELIEDLIIESIRIYGIDTYYLPRIQGAKDELLNEDDLASFNDAYIVEMYIKNVDGFEGEGDFLSKFGLQIRDSMTLTVAIRSFNQEIGVNTTQTRPFEGDLIYFPLNRKFFKVMHVEHEAIFYQLGQIQTYDLRCELFEYSGETFNTGHDFIDDYFERYDVSRVSREKTFVVTVGDKTESNPFFGRGSSKTFFIDGVENPKIELYAGTSYFFDQSDASNANNEIRFHSSLIIGPNTLVSGQTYVGNPGESNAGLSFTPVRSSESFYVNSDPQILYMGNEATINKELENDPFADNDTIEDIGDDIISFTEENPFGEDNY